MAGAAPQSGQEDHSTAALWIVGAIFVILGIIWYVFKKYIVAFYLMIKLYELDIVSIFARNSSRIAEVKAAIAKALANPAVVPFNEMVNIGHIVGVYIRMPLVLFLIVLAFVVYFSNLTRTFKRSYSMRELAQNEHVNWPQITPVLNVDLIKTDIDKGPWAMAMTPIQFCKKYRLLEEHKPQRREGMSRRDWNRLEVSLKRGQANKVFAVQLGPLWEGTAKLPPYTKALFAIFAARINADTAPALALLRQLSESSSGQLNYAGVDELCKKHEGSKLVQKIVGEHAYVYTVMASMLEAARLDGVQASADFLWLKPIDRRLWYMMNTVGRQTPYAEVAGPFAHWRAEKEAGVKLIVPMVEMATKALEIALKEVVYRPDEEEGQAPTQ